MTRINWRIGESANRRIKRQGGIPAWTFAVILLLLTWGLRVCCLETVPPGWRDDELINIHALSGELLEGRFPLYFTGASGHEPLYHWLHAGVHAVLGFNVLSGHLLSVAFGVLSVALTYALARRLFGRATAVVASLALAVSFWSLMYSRTAIRHISLPPCALAAFYLFWRSIHAPHGPHHAPHGPQSVRPWRKLGWGANPRRTWFLVGLFVGLSVYIYPAARLLPVLLCLSMAHLALFHRERFKRYWRGFLLALAVVALLAVPLGVAIAQGRSEAATQGIGADARLAELAVPLRELRAGNPRPLLESTWITLGMFHATGDSEWLYNISGRPVFNLLGGALLWAGVVLCLCRWRRPRYFFLLLWLGLGLLPAFLSTPPASLSHTILAQPVAYILPALALTEACRWLTAHTSQATIRNTSLAIGRSHYALRITHYASRITQIIIFIFLATNAIRDLRDYFVTWPQRGMVRFLYRADYRDVAHYLNAHPEITDVAISSTLMGPWDRLALEVDTRRDAVAVRMFNPERVMVYPAGGTSYLILPLASAVAPQVQAVIDRGWHPLENDAGPFYVFVSSEREEAWLRLAENWFTPATPHSFANGMVLLGWGWPEGLPAAGRTVTLLTAWGVSGPLDMPPVPIVANPPPPGVYSGPRLAVFTHLLAADGTFLAGDDGLWVDPLTLRAGDRFIQLHRFVLPPADVVYPPDVFHPPPTDSDPHAPLGPSDVAIPMPPFRWRLYPYMLELGLYDPLTGERWGVLESGEQPAADCLLLPLTE